MLKYLRRILEMSGSAGLYVTTNGTTLLEALGLVCNKIQPLFLKIKAGKTFSYNGHALVTFYVQFLYSDWSKFDR